MEDNSNKFANGFAKGADVNSDYSKENDDLAKGLGHKLQRIPKDSGTYHAGSTLLHRRGGKGYTSEFYNEKELNDFSKKEKQPQQPNYKRGYFPSDLGESFVGYYDGERKAWKGNYKPYFTKDTLDKLQKKYYSDQPNVMRYNKEKDSYIFNPYANEKDWEHKYPDNEWGDEYKGEDIKVGDKTIRAYPFLYGSADWYNGKDWSDEKVKKVFSDAEDRIKNSKLDNDKKQEYFNKFNEIKNRNIEDVREEDVISLLDDLSADEPLDENYKVYGAMKNQNDAKLESYIKTLMSFTGATRESAEKEIKDRIAKGELKL